MVPDAVLTTSPSRTLRSPELPEPMRNTPSLRNSPDTERSDEKAPPVLSRRSVPWLCRATGAARVLATVRVVKLPANEPATHRVGAGEVPSPTSSWSTVVVPVSDTV